MERLPLARAAQDGDADLVAWLLAEGAEADEPCRDRRTALDLAVCAGHTEVVFLLLAAGADPRQQAGPYDELEPLCLAVMRGHTEVAALLLDAGVDPDAPTRVLRYQALVLAATAGETGYPQTVDLLLDHGADIDVRMKDRTALDWATAFGQEEMVRHLLARGATRTQGAEPIRSG